MSSYPFRVFNVLCLLRRGPRPPPLPLPPQPPLVRPLVPPRPYFPVSLFWTRTSPAAATTTAAAYAPICPSASLFPVSLLRTRASPAAAAAAAAAATACTSCSLDILRTLYTATAATYVSSPLPRPYFPVSPSWTRASPAAAAAAATAAAYEGLARRRYRYRHNRRLYAPLSLRVLIFLCPCFGREPCLLPLPLPPLLIRLFVPPRSYFLYPCSGREPYPPLPLPLIYLIPSIF